MSSTRRDGSQYSAGTDSLAFAAEEWVASIYGVTADETVYSDKGDSGYDFKLPNGTTVDVKHLGLQADGEPRQTGNLIVNQDTQHPYADWFVMVKGLPGSFQMVGWISASEFRFHRVLRDFGYGQKWSVPVGMLRL